MSTEQKEKRILLFSFVVGLLFALVEFIFAIYSRSQSALMDAAYDTSELVFIVLILFLTPLFHKPISEKQPFGFFQIESIFLIVKGFMLLAVTVSLSAGIIQTLLAGGASVNSSEVSLFQLVLGVVSIGVFVVLQHMNRSVYSPTVKAELLGWKIDIAFSIGMAAAFFASSFLDQTPFAFLAPYFDQVVALGIVLFTIPESIKMLGGAIKDVFLFSPDEETVDKIKEECSGILSAFAFEPVFYDITRTGRRLWVAIYFKIAEDCLYIAKLEHASAQVSSRLAEHFENCACELILVPKN